MGLCAPPVRQPWQGHAVCWAALMRRLMAFLEAAAVDIVCVWQQEVRGRGRNTEREGVPHL